jgi:regulatory protein
MAKTITALKIQKGNPGRVSIFLNHRYAFAVKLLNAASLTEGQRLTEKEIAELTKEDERFKAYRSAIRYLAYRPRSHKETKEHLSRKRFSPVAVAHTINRLIVEKLLDDAEFARFWLESRTRNKPLSKSALKYELRQKGVDRTIIESVTVDLDDLTLARMAVKGRLNNFKGLSPQAFKRKLLGYLHRRGFNFETSLKAYQYGCAQLTQPDDPSVTDKIAVKTRP